MTENNWESEGTPAARKGLPTWAKVLLGCLGGCLLVAVILVVSCVGIFRQVSKDPEGFEKRVEGWVKSYASEHWKRFRDAAEALRSPEAARDLYGRSPDLKDTYPTEADFLKAVEGWRPLLEPVPADMPMKHGDVQFSQQGRGSYVIGYRNSKGTRIRMTFEKEQLTRVSIRAGEPTPVVPPVPEPPEPPKD